MTIPAARATVLAWKARRFRRKPQRRPGCQVADGFRPPVLTVVTFLTVLTSAGLTSDLCRLTSGILARSLTFESRSATWNVALLKYVPSLATARGPGASGARCSIL